MNRACPALIVAVLLASARIASSDPLADVLDKGQGTACFVKEFDEAFLAEHQAQTTHAVLLSLRKLQDTSDAVVRIRISHEEDSVYVVGRCEYSDDANADVLDNRIVQAFRGKAGLACQATTRSAGSSSAEGGDFPVALGNHGEVTLYLPETLSAWTSTDRTGTADSVEFGGADQAFQLDRTDSAACADIIKDLPWR